MEQERHKRPSKLYVRIFRENSRNAFRMCVRRGIKLTQLADAVEHNLFTGWLTDMVQEAQWWRLNIDVEEEHEVHTNRYIRHTFMYRELGLHIVLLQLQLFIGSES